MVGLETLTLSRDLYVPRELVFEVWTQPEHLAEWYSPGPDFDRNAEVDPRVGGAYRLCWRDADGIEYRQTGNYELLQPPARLVYSASIEPAAAGPTTTRVSVTLTDLGGGTRIDVEERGLPDARHREARARHWALLLDNLEAYFSAI